MNYRKKVKITLTYKQLGFVLLGLEFYQDCGGKQDEKFAFELRDKIIQQVRRIENETTK